jgi:hypothetical protein
MNMNKLISSIYISHSPVCFASFQDEGLVCNTLSMLTRVCRTSIKAYQIIVAFDIMPLCAAYVSMMCQSTHTHTCIHTHILTYLLTYLHTYMNTYIHTYIHTCIHTYIHACMHTFRSTFINSLIDSFTYFPTSRLLQSTRAVICAKTCNLVGNLFRHSDMFYQSAKT